MVRFASTSNLRNYLYSNSYVIVSFALIILSIVLSINYQEEMVGFGKFLLERYGHNKLELTLFFITLISSTPLNLPVWIYAVYGSFLGFNPVRLLLVITIGSTTGVLFTYFLGRYFGSTDFIRRKFPNIENNPWTSGKSYWIVSAILFIGTALTIPIDVVYAACGLKKHPIYHFILFVFVGKLVPYSLFVLGSNYLLNSGFFNL